MRTRSLLDSVKSPPFNPTLRSRARHLNPDSGRPRAGKNSRAPWTIRWSLSHSSALSFSLGSLEKPNVKSPIKRRSFAAQPNNVCLGSSFPAGFALYDRVFLLVSFNPLFLFLAGGDHNIRALLKVLIMLMGRPCAPIHFPAGESSGWNFLFGDRADALSSAYVLAKIRSAIFV